MNAVPLDDYIKIFEDNHGILKLSQAEKLGVPKHIVYTMLSKEILVKEERGIYRLVTTDLLSNPDLVEVSLLVPKSVVCMISALYYHELTTQIPHDVHIALPSHTPKPRIEYPPIRVYRMSKSSFEAGIEKIELDGVLVRIYNREKTIADCFKFRNKIGESIAIEALRDYSRGPNQNFEKILKYARINRVEKVMQPYLRSLLA